MNTHEWNHCFLMQNNMLQMSLSLKRAIERKNDKIKDAQIVKSWGQNQCRCSEYHFGQYLMLIPKFSCCCSLLQKNPNQINHYKKGNELFWVIQPIKDTVFMTQTLKELCGASVLCWRPADVSRLHFLTNFSYCRSLLVGQTEAQRGGTW